MVKLREPRRAAAAARSLGIPVAESVWAGVAAGAIEVVVALALAFGAPSAAVAATALFAAFALLLARALASGKSVECFCFGDSGKTVDRLSLARTSGLCILAALLAASGTAAGTVSRDSEVVVAAIAGAAVLAIVVLAVAAVNVFASGRSLSRDARERFAL